MAKQVIDGLIYDTSTATEICECGSTTRYVSDFNYWSAKLYRTPRGRFFLYGNGGPMTFFSQPCGNNSWSGGGGVIPISMEEARRYAESSNMDADEIALYFDLELA